MNHDLITPGQLAQLPADATAITLVGTPDGYGIAVGPADRVRWLAGTAGTANGCRVYRSLDAAIAILNACGHRRATIDITGGRPQ